VVLLFFDLDEPGTTGEMLSKLLHSLGEMDHKLLIVLNKANQFKKMHDFAHAYGLLCWKLSKVIPWKDLPRIFTMCLPVADRKDGDQVSSSGDGVVPTIQVLAGPARPCGPAPDKGRRDCRGDEGAEAQDRQCHHPPARLGPPPAHAHGGHQGRTVAVFEAALGEPHPGGVIAVVGDGIGGAGRVPERAAAIDGGPCCRHGAWHGGGCGGSIPPI